MTSKLTTNNQNIDFIFEASIILKMSFPILSKVEFEFVFNDSEIVECQENKIQECRSSHTFFYFTDIIFYLAVGCY